MNQSVVIKIKNVYGNDLIYPINESAQYFAKLVNQKTLSLTQLKIIQALGFTIEESKPENLKGLLK